MAKRKLAKMRADYERLMAQERAKGGFQHQYADLANSNNNNNNNDSNNNSEAGGSEVKVGGNASMRSNDEEFQRDPNRFFRAQSPASESRVLASDRQMGAFLPDIHDPHSGSRSAGANAKRRTGRAKVCYAFVVVVVVFVF